MTKVILLTFAMCFVVVAVQGASVPPELAEIGKGIRATCMEETGSTLEMVENTGKGVFSDDDRFKCYAKCVLNQLSLIRHDDINFEAMLRLVPAQLKDTAPKMIRDCRETLTGADLCERASNLNKCFYQANPEDYFVL